MSQVQFLYGPKQTYEALSVKNDNTLYFLTDTYEIYKGNDLYTRSYEIAESAADVVTAKENYLYVFKKTGQLAIYNGTFYEYLTPPISSNDILGGNENDIPTVGAVKKIIETLQNVIDTNTQNIANNAAAIDSNAQAIAILKSGPEVEGSVANITAEAVAEIVGGAGEGFDTLKDIANWISNDATGAARMANDIKDIKDVLGLDGSTSSSTGGALVKRVEKLEENTEIIKKDLTDTTTTTSTGYRLAEAENKISTLESKEDVIDIVVTPRLNETTKIPNQHEIKIGYHETPGYISVNGIGVLVVNVADFATVKYVDNKYDTIQQTLAAQYYTKEYINQQNFVRQDNFATSLNALNNRIAETYVSNAVAQDTYVTKTDFDERLATVPTVTFMNQRIGESTNSIVGAKLTDALKDYQKIEDANAAHNGLSEKIERDIETAISKLNLNGSSGLNAKWEALS